LIATIAAFGAASTAAHAHADDQNYRIGDIKVGDRVAVDPGLMHKWQSCTVTALKPVYSNPSLIDNLTVRCANGTTYQAMATPQMVRKGAGAPATEMGPVAPRYATPGAQQATQAAAAAAAIPSGLYLCKAGNTRNMLTLGNMRITGNRFTFTDPVGYRTAGSYSIGAKGYSWQGNVGRISNAQIVSSGPEPGLKSFWFMFRESPGSLPQSVSCGRIG
jgi:hypothetical protein